MGAFSVEVHASAGDGSYSGESEVITGAAIEATVINDVINQSMIINATWLNDEMLRIDVTDISTGALSSLAIRLCDFVADAEGSPYILIQAADLDGNLSGVIQISNPFYVPSVSTADSVVADSSTTGSAAGDEADQSELDGYEDYMDYEYNGGEQTVGFTPDGTGTVVDNVVNENSVEFFTVFTEEGNEFFLVVDRQRNSDNVYLLNAVTEADLMALAERSGSPIDNQAVSAIPPIGDITPPVDENHTNVPTPTPEPELEPEPQPSGAGGINSGFVIILIVAAIACAAGYYFKIIKPRKDAAYDDDDFIDDDNDDYGYDEAVNERGYDDEGYDDESYDSEDGRDE